MKLDMRLIATKAWRAFKWFAESYWLPASFCGVACGITAFGAYTAHAGFLRDFLWMMSGVFVGYMIVVLITPMRLKKFSADQLRYMENETALTFIKAAVRASDVTGLDIRVGPAGGFGPPPGLGKPN